MVDKNCTSKCVCQASGLVTCEKLSCASGEECVLRNGVRGCRVQPGRCKISPAAHLTSFDGISGAIGARGAFEAASLCDETASLWFRVVVDVRVCREGASVATVHVFFKETVVTVNNRHETWVRRAGRNKEKLHVKGRNLVFLILEVFIFLIKIKILMDFACLLVSPFFSR